MKISHLRKQFFFALILMMAVVGATAQTTIVQWNFNSVFGSISMNGAAPAPSTGTGNIMLTGGVTDTSASGVAPGDPGPYPGTTPNNALNTSNYPIQYTSGNNNAKTGGIIISANTTGYSNIHLKYFIRNSSSAAKKIVVQYKNGTLWQDDTSYIIATSGNYVSNTTPMDINLSAIAAVNNVANAQIRLVTDTSGTGVYQGTGGAYSTGGTIRYDLVTVTGVSMGCMGSATQQATGLRLLKTDNSSAQLTLNRGNGGGCLVLCSAAGVPSTTPVNTVNYAASDAYGSGAAIGNAYAVYNTQAGNPSTQYFNITSLTAGTKYYVAAYEYSSSGYCYLSPALVDSFICNSTVLYPGDIQFVGYDNGIASGGKDAFVLTNLAPLNPGTTFQIVNSRYEAGAAANTRTQRWYAGSNNPNDDLETISILYNGTSQLPSGSIISFEFLAPSGSNIQVNGGLSTQFSITSNNIISGVSMLSGSAPEQFFLTQGRFKTYGTSGTDQFSLLNGHVLHGISYTNNWVPFTQAVNGMNNANRESRLPPDIKCLNLFFPGATNFGYYNPTGQFYSGNQGYLFSQINDISNWTNGPGTSGNDIPATVLSKTFNVATGFPSGQWTGENNNNWFDCRNWLGRTVPDSTTDVSILAVVNKPYINSNNDTAVEYGRQATTRMLAVNDDIYINGTGVDKLVVYDSLTISTNGSFYTSGGIDTVIVRGSMTTNGQGLVWLADNGWLSLQGNRLLKPVYVSLPSTTIPMGVYGLSINNPPGVIVTKGGYESLKKLELANGILSFTSDSAFHYMGADCDIISPVNQYAEMNKGWEKSFIDGLVYVRAHPNGNYTAPLGSTLQNVFEPMVFVPGNGADRTFVAGYNAYSHPHISPADISSPPLDHVSDREFWTLTCPTDSLASAMITLYYSPYSRVGQGGGMVGQALADLLIAQYWDSTANGNRIWHYPTYPVTYSHGANSIDYGYITCDQFATDLLNPDKSFTLASRSAFNTLPVQLLTWEAALQNGRTLLSWQLADEKDIAFYTIEKSTDGINYQLLETVAATVFVSGQPYSRYDNYPAGGWNFYRLKLTGSNGKISYSVVKKVWVKSTFALAVFPNPAKELLYVSLPASTGGTLILIAPDGRTCLQQTVGNSLIKMNIKGLPPGIYLLEYTDGHYRQTEKVMIR